MRGRYIALEGVEGAGKTTVTTLLAEELEGDGLEVLTVREPGGTEAGELVRQVLLDPGGRLAPWTEALLFAAARAQLADEVVGPALDEGRWVVSDRSVYSSLAYQGGGRGLGVEVVRAVNAHGLGDVWPDLVILLRLEVEDGLARQQIADRIGLESAAFLRRVAQTFDRLAAEEPDRFVVLSATRPVGEVVKEAREAVADRWR